jgi:uncharacterized protein (DUF1778 family)
MDLTPYLQSVREEVGAAAEAGGDQAVALAERLVAATESALRLALLEALSDAAAEISLDLAPGSVELRLRGREPEFVVRAAAATEPAQKDDQASVVAAAWIPSEGDDATMTRINVRLPQDLKERVEDGARLAGLSVNAWLVRAAAAALPGGDRPVSQTTRSKGGARYSGWVR